MLSPVMAAFRFSMVLVIGNEFIIILKSGKEFEIKLVMDLKKMNNNEMLEQFATVLDQGNIFVFDKSVVKNSEIAAIVDITEN